MFKGNKLVEKLKDQWRRLATRKAENYCKNNSVTNEQVFYQKYYEAYKVLAKDDVEKTINEFKEIMQSKGWEFYQQLLKNAVPDGFENATFTEKQAFMGYRQQIIDAALKIPQEFIEYYEELQTEGI